MPFSSRTRPHAGLARGGSGLWIALAAVALLPGRLEAQGIPRSAYLHYVPLDPPRLTREAPASARLHLFGDTADPAYRDVAPRDGIDDRRHEVLEAMAARFAPFLVQNTASMPLDFKRFWRTQRAFPMHIDTWELATGRQLVASETIDMNALGTAACPGETGTAPPGGENTDDCRLVALLDAFDPYGPSALLSRVTAILPDRDQVTVMYFDMPGHDEASWKAAWVNPSTDRLRNEYQGLTQVYVHPFIQEYLGEDGAATGYDLVLQYWFYYPINDGGNNHEGDWEHINVVVAPRGRVMAPLDESTVHRVLTGEGLHDRPTDGQIVIRRVEYYLHHKLMVLDYGRPSVYQDRDAWKADADRLLAERVTEEWLWESIRRLAYRDAAETEVNTHPVVYIGGDNKGLDQLIATPGGSNQDSHASYPFPGLYKNIGPGGSGESVSHRFDHQAWYAAPRDEGTFRGGGVTLYDRPELIDIVPDWERVLPLVGTDPEARREWAWLVLPVRWGYPASPSPIAGLVEHADMGNVGPIGPAYNAGWNRAGAGSGFEYYEPHVLPGLFPADPQDAFGNELGFLNVIPLIGNLPPLDFLWRFLALPVRAATGENSPLFYPSETVPERFFGIAGGMGWETISQDISAAVFHTPEAYRAETPPLSPQLIEIALDLLLLDTGTVSGGGLSENFADPAWATQMQVAFYLGPRFVSTTGFRHARHDAGFRIGVNTRPEPYEFRAGVDMWDVTGSVRYNLATGALKPYVKGGYGANWYRLEDMTSDGEALLEPTGPWIVNVWPLTWQYGGGFEFMLVHRFAPVPRGFDLGVQAEWLWFNGPTGIAYPDVLTIASVRDAPTRVVRGALNLSLSLSF